MLRFAPWKVVAILGMIVVALLLIAPNVRVRVARAMVSEVRAKGEPVKDAVKTPA